MRGKMTREEGIAHLNRSYDLILGLTQEQDRKLEVQNLLLVMAYMTMALYDTARGLR